MAIKNLNEKPRSATLEIDLTGPDGNVFVLMGIAKQYARKMDMDYSLIQKQMMSGDYENAIKVFDKYFGTYVTLYR